MKRRSLSLCTLVLPSSTSGTINCPSPQFLHTNNTKKKPTHSKHNSKHRLIRPYIRRNGQKRLARDLVEPERGTRAEEEPAVEGGGEEEDELVHARDARGRADAVECVARVHLRVRVVIMRLV